MPFCVGLTGGIGSGKSVVSDMFQALGAVVVDTDEISRALTAPGGAAIAGIREQFGPGSIAPDGGLDRERMRLLVFRDAQSRQQLEAILHPQIRARTRAAIDAARAPYVIVVVPLLFETGACMELVRRVLVVDCDEAEQVRRVTTSRGIAAEEVRRIMATQLPRAERLRRADDVLHNDRGIEALRGQVGELHARYLELARRA
ncbi:MAG TPA: dephospho-CoA kinase [Burkholderiales bacterium]|nr:dephospho-CoA kinase [Burkholderiales bacterium]